MSAPPTSLTTLPTEVRLLILEYLVPTNTDIIIHRDRDCRDRERYAGGHPGRLSKGLSFGAASVVMRSCRQLYLDVLSLLYGTNSIHFAIGTQLSETLRLNAVDFVSPDGLRLIKRLNVEVQEELAEPAKYREVVRRLEKLVTVLSDRHSLLQLSVSVRADAVFNRTPYNVQYPSGGYGWVGRPPQQSNTKKYQYVLEPLAALKVAEVRIESVDPSFAEKLSYIMTAKDKLALQRLQYAEEEYQVRKRKRGSRAKPKEWSTCTRTTKKFWEPVYDWESSARNWAVEESLMGSLPDGPQSD